MKQTVHGVTLTWAWWWLQTGNPRSWRGCCQSSQCPSLWRTASWTAAACKPEWSGPAASRDVRLGRWSAEPASEKTGGSGCSPSERELRTGDRKARVESELSTRKSFFSTKRMTCPGNTLLQLHGTDRTWVVSVKLLEQHSPPLHEVPQCREAEHVYSARPCLVKHVWWGRQCRKNIHSLRFSTMLFTILFKQRTNGRYIFPCKHTIDHTRSRVLKSHTLDYGNATLVAWNVQNETNIICSSFLANFPVLLLPVHSFDHNSCWRWIKSKSDQRHLLIIIRQVSSLKDDQLELTSACFSSFRFMKPLWSESTLWNHW